MAADIGANSSLAQLFSGYTVGGDTTADPGTDATDATLGAPTSPNGSNSGGDLVSSVQQNLEQSLAINSALQQLYLAYSTFTEALRIISEAVQKGIDISENERQDISQGQE